MTDDLKDMISDDIKRTVQQCILPPDQMLALEDLLWPSDEPELQYWLDKKGEVKNACPLAVWAQ